MNFVIRIDHQIARPDTFKVAEAGAEVQMKEGEFAKSLSEATQKLDNDLGHENEPHTTRDEPLGVASKAEASSFSLLRVQDWLVDTEAQARASRPNMREFMDATGLTAADASELLYGVIGSNADLRDWSKIMASGNPVDAARAATGQLYNSDKDYALVKHQDYGQLNFEETLAQSSLPSKTVVQQQGNFATIEADNGLQHTMAVSSTGLILRGAGTTQAQIERTAWLFGFDASGLFGQA